MNKRLIVPVLTVVTAAAIAAGAATVSAQSNDETGYPSIVTKIAERFSLNQDEVQAVFDESREEHHADMLERIEDRLSDAVSVGELTEEQKQAILIKMEEMHTEREANFEAFKNMTAEERREAMEAKKAEMEAWAEEQGIDTKYMMFMHGRGQGGPGGFKMKFSEEAGATTETET